ncbi:hypothetical protein D3C76_1258550 [compost metagenome]
MFLQHRAQFFQALSIGLGQRIVDLVQTPVDTQECSVLVGGHLIGHQESIDARPQHGGVTANEPILVTRLADQHLAVEAQLGQDLAPALRDGLLDDGQMKNPALDHFQDILHRQGGIDPFDLHRR